MTKIINFALKIKGVGREGDTCEVLRPCHPFKIETCTFIQAFNGEMADIITNLTLQPTWGLFARTIRLLILTLKLFYLARTAYMRFVKWVSLMKEVVMCNKNLRHKSLLKVNRPLEFIEAPYFDFALFGEGVTAILSPPTLPLSFKLLVEKWLTSSPT